VFDIANENELWSMYFYDQSCKVKYSTLLCELLSIDK